VVERSRTPWRKSRTFGDIYGGRMRRRMTDNIFNWLHSLSPPSPHDSLPHVIAENPSRDYFFPVGADDLVDRLRELPEADVAGITHLWLRRVNTDTFENGLPFAEFICGSRVRVIVMYPWCSDRRLDLGTKQPSTALLRRYSKWSTDLVRDDRRWWLQWEIGALREFTTEHLLLHEIWVPRRLVPESLDGVESTRNRESC
jgi:hypothetical protein